MRKVICLLVVMVLFLVFSLEAFAFENEPKGLRGLKWGDPPTEEMEFLKVTGSEVAYTLPEDKLHLGNVSLYMVLYRFYEFRFFGVLMRFKYEENYNLLEMICKDRFGEVFDEGFYELSWGGERVIVILKYDLSEEDGYLAIVNRAISREMSEAEKKKEAEKAAGDW